MRMLVLLSILTVGFSASFAHAQTPITPIQALRSQISVRLERTSPTNLAISDRGGEQVAKDLQAVVDLFRQQVRTYHFADALKTMSDMFEIIPNSDRAFAGLLPAPKDIRNAPTTVIAIRRAFYDIGRIAVDNAELRTFFLEKSNQLFERHINLAADGKRFTELFGLLTGHFHELAAYETRLSARERAALAYNRQVYNRAFVIMQTAERNAPAKPKAPAQVQICESLFIATR